MQEAPRQTRTNGHDPYNKGATANPASDHVTVILTLDTLSPQPHRAVSSPSQPAVPRPRFAHSPSALPDTSSFRPDQAPTHIDFSCAATDTLKKFKSYVFRNTPRLVHERKSRYVFGTSSDALLLDSSVTLGSLTGPGHPALVLALFPRASRRRHYEDAVEKGDTHRESRRHRHSTRLRESPSAARHSRLIEDRDKETTRSRSKDEPRTSREDLYDTLTRSKSQEPPRPRTRDHSRSVERYSPRRHEGSSPRAHSTRSLGGSRHGSRSGSGEAISGGANRSREELPVAGRSPNRSREEIMPEEGRYSLSSSPSRDHELYIPLDQQVSRSPSFSSPLGGVGAADRHQDRARRDSDQDRTHAKQAKPQPASAPTSPIARRFRFGLNPFSSPPSVESPSSTPPAYSPPSHQMRPSMSDRGGMERVTSAEARWSDPLGDRASSMHIQRKIHNTILGSTDPNHHHPHNGAPRSRHSRKSSAPTVHVSPPSPLLQTSQSVSSSPLLSVPLLALDMLDYPNPNARAHPSPPSSPSSPNPSPRVAFFSKIISKLQGIASPSTSPPSSPQRRPSEASAVPARMQIAHRNTDPEMVLPPTSVAIATRIKPGKSFSRSAPPSPTTRPSFNFGSRRREPDSDHEPEPDHESDTDTPHPIHPVPSIPSISAPDAAGREEPPIIRRTRSSAFLVPHPPIGPRRSPMMVPSSMPATSLLTAALASPSEFDASVWQSSHLRPLQTPARVTIGTRSPPPDIPKATTRQDKGKQKAAPDQPGPSSAPSSPGPSFPSSSSPSTSSPSGSALSLARTHQNRHAKGTLTKRNFFGDVDQRRLVASFVPGYIIEAGDALAPSPWGTLGINVIHKENDVHYYRDMFYRETHYNYVGEGEIVSVLGRAEEGQYRVIRWSPEGFHRLFIPETWVRKPGRGSASFVMASLDTEGGSPQIPSFLSNTPPSSSSSSSPLQMLEKRTGKGARASANVANSVLVALAALYPTVRTKPLSRVKSPSLCDALVEMEATQVVRSYKVGLLYARPGQLQEEDMYSNVVPSPDFHEFASFLGETIRLRGWAGYRGGLDTVHDMTGTHSLFTRFTPDPTSPTEYEIMFHVSTMLPFSPSDPQQVDRKRHLGNDIVVIVFVDGPCDTPFNPRCLTSDYNQCYIVVTKDTPNRDQAGEDRKGKSVGSKLRAKFERTFTRRGPGLQQEEPDATYYRISCARKEAVPSFPPLVPCPSLFEKGEYFRQFLLTKVINAERASYTVPHFNSRIVRTRRGMIQDLVNKHV
eukprot:TRINITY_DN2718_c0_g1_i1.p1 TRINITY_DN2718_c0_g1~~TRINITY_DN2718_c0_g1_i1.p1  ORF type:complete len:1266 (-),score=329.83 TRINITY_DN2718_c0_g1_i1:7-3804(-)